MTATQVRTNSVIRRERAPDPAAYELGGFDPTYYQHERYIRGREHSRGQALAAYYALKPLIPRAAQLRLRRLYARRQARRAFPAWPIEPILVHRQHEDLRRAIRENGEARIPFVGFWPDHHTSACVLTHDVEGPSGIANIERVLAVEQRYGLTSSWNFVAEDYHVPEHTLARLRDAGCEIGLHGVKHDCKLFRSRSDFESNLPGIRSGMRALGAVGFRSPATHRRAEWMHELGCLYDSSFPDTDPFEPQPGGCCSIFPFMFGNVVELPITLTQDHTLWEILRHDSPALWLRKAAWVMRNLGLVNIITHPDYFTEPKRFRMYEELLEFLAWSPGCWRALPRDIAEWWLRRQTVTCELTASGARLAGNVDGRAFVMWARETGDRIEFES